VEYCIFVEPQVGASWDELSAAALAADRLGFDGFFRSDHLIPPGRELLGTPAVSDAWTTLAGLARDTERIRLGTLVSPVTFRNPGTLAVQVANVDAMSRGRVELGLGAGWNRDEHDAYGIPFPDKRFGRFEEQLQIITGLWASQLGTTFSFDGEHYRLVDAPGGVQSPFGERIPVIIGGAGAQRTPALAARYADEFNANFAPNEVIARLYAGAIRACEAVGRDPGSLKLSSALTSSLPWSRVLVKPLPAAGRY